MHILFSTILSIANIGQTFKYLFQIIVIHLYYDVHGQILMVWTGLYYCEIRELRFLPVAPGGDKGLCPSSAKATLFRGDIGVSSENLDGCDKVSNPLSRKRIVDWTVYMNFLLSSKGDSSKNLKFYIFSEKTHFQNFSTKFHRNIFILRSICQNYTANPSPLSGLRVAGSHGSEATPPPLSDKSWRYLCYSTGFSYKTLLISCTMSQHLAQNYTIFNVVTILSLRNFYLHPFT